MIAFLQKYWWAVATIAIVLFFSINALVKSQQAIERIEEKSGREGIKEKIFPLKMGSKNEKVTKLQEWMNKESDPNIAVDGIFGPETETRLNALTEKKQISKQEFENKVG